MPPPPDARFAAEPATVASTVFAFAAAEPARTIYMTDAMLRRHRLLYVHAVYAFQASAIGFRHFTDFRHFHAAAATPDYAVADAVFAIFSQIDIDFSPIFHCYGFAACVILLFSPYYAATTADADMIRFQLSPLSGDIDERYFLFA
jgi:predicted aminopeptidase